MEGDSGAVSKVRHDHPLRKFEENLVTNTKLLRRRLTYTWLLELSRLVCGSATVSLAPVHEDIGTVGQVSSIEDWILKSCRPQSSRVELEVLGRLLCRETLPLWVRLRGGSHS